MYVLSCNSNWELSIVCKIIGFVSYIIFYIYDIPIIFPSLRLGKFTVEFLLLPTRISLIATSFLYPCIVFYNQITQIVNKGIIVQVTNTVALIHRV